MSLDVLQENGSNQTGSQQSPLVEVQNLKKIFSYQTRYLQKNGWKREGCR